MNGFRQRTDHRSFSLKTIASLTMVFFIATQIFLPEAKGFAQNSGPKVGGADAVSSSATQLFNGNAVIPPELGKIEESFQGASGKVIYFIQDAHDSLEAQENIAEITSRLVEKGGTKTVFEEGYEGAVPTLSPRLFFGPFQAEKQYISLA